MKGIISVLLMFSFVLIQSSCKKDYEFSEYTTGFFKFTYTDTVLVNGAKVPKDTTVLFTSVGYNPTEKDHYGYFDRAKLETHLGRLDQKDFVYNATLHLNGVDLNSIRYPYTVKYLFQGNVYENAYLVFGYGRKDTIISGQPSNMYLDYRGDVNSGVSLTLESKPGNRVLGRFSGVLSNQEGRKIKVRDGVFDIQYVEK